MSKLSIARLLADGELPPTLYSTYEIYRKADFDRRLEDDLTAVENSVTALQSGKANVDHTHDTATAETSGFMSNGDKSKLDGIEAGANNYVHPATHSASMITGLPTELPANGGNADTVDGKHAADFATANHIHTQYEVTGLSSALSGKANTDHTHSNYALASDLNALSDDVSGKAAASHTHTLDNISETTTKKVMTADERTKLSGIATGANKTIVDTAMSSTSTNPVQNKTVNSALGNKVDKVTGKGLSTNDYTTDEKTKLAGIATGANKYTHPTSHPATMITGLSDVATSGSYNDLSDKPTSMTPKAHTHAQSDITGLATALNGKADTNHTHNYCTLNQVYPVGSVYLSVSSTNPSTLFGGTWVAFGTGRVLMGVKSGESAEATGGSETASLSAHSHTTASHKLTVAEMPAHHHEILNYNENGITTDTFTKNSVEGLIKKGWTGNVMTSYTGSTQAHSHGNTGSAGAATINIVQPYITCYMWKRTN